MNRNTQLGLVAIAALVLIVAVIYWPFGGPTDDLKLRRAAIERAVERIDPRPEVAFVSFGVPQLSDTPQTSPSIQDPPAAFFSLPAIEGTRLLPASAARFETDRAPAESTGGRTGPWFTIHISLDDNGREAVVVQSTFTEISLSGRTDYRYTVKRGPDGEWDFTAAQGTTTTRYLSQEEARELREQPRQDPPGTRSTLHPR